MGTGKIRGLFSSLGDCPSHPDLSTDAEKPAVDLIDFESASDLDDCWHTPYDARDKLSADSLDISLRLALRAAAIAAGGGR